MQLSGNAENPVDDRPDIRLVPVILVHHQPLIMSQCGDGRRYPRQLCDVVADEGGQYDTSNTSQRQIQRIRR